MQSFIVSFLFGAELPQAQQGASITSSLLMMGLFFLAFWFLMISPQRKRQKAQKEMLAALKVGDEIITSSGFLASIVQVKEDRLVIKTGDAKLEIYKQFVQSVHHHK